ncbi:hypothetical protein [Mycobacterium sp. C31M]
MTRMLVFTDRLVSVLVGVAMVAAAAFILLSPTKVFDLPTAIDLGSLIDVTRQPWWPWASGSAGVVGVVIATYWLFRHIPSGRSPAVRVRRPGQSAVIVVRLDAVASAAAEAAAQQSRIVSAQGRAVTEGRSRLITLTAAIDHPDALPEVIGTVTSVCTDIASVTGDPDVAVRTVLHLPKLSDRTTFIR